MQIIHRLISLLFFICVMVASRGTLAVENSDINACDKKAIDFYRLYRGKLLAQQFHSEEIRGLVSKETLKNIRAGKEDVYLANLRVIESRVLRILEFSATCDGLLTYLYLKTINIDEAYSFRIIKMLEVDNVMVTYYMSDDDPTKLKEDDKHIYKIWPH